MRCRIDSTMGSRRMSSGSQNAMSVDSSLTERSVNDAGVEAHRELLADLAVVVSKDVTRVGVDADDPIDLDAEAGLFEGLTLRAARQRFADLHRAARESPHVVVTSALKQDSAVVVGHHHRCRRNQRVRCRGVRVIEEVLAAHDPSLRRNSAGRFPGFGELEIGAAYGRPDGLEVGCEPGNEAVGSETPQVQQWWPGFRAWRKGAA